MPPIRKRFGQNFLTDRGALTRIADALQLTGAETVVEIGPGRGALTDLVATRCARLIGIEIDRDLVTLLQARYEGQSHITIVAADVLDTSLGAVADGPYVLCGNVPYYVTTPILFHALRPPRPTHAVFLVQKEVAERLVAMPGTPEYGALTVNMRLAADVELAGHVGAGSFFPRPQVDSAIVRLRYHAAAAPDDEEVRAFVVGLFGQRRRQLARALRTVSGCEAAVAQQVLERTGLAPDVRAETLAPGQFVQLYRELRGRPA